MEGVVHDVRPFGKNVSNAFEVHIVKLHVEESMLKEHRSRAHIDPVALQDIFPRNPAFLKLSLYWQEAIIRQCRHGIESAECLASMSSCRSWGEELADGKRWAIRRR